MAKLREMYRGRFFPIYSQLVILDAQNPVLPQWDGSEEETVFGANGVAFAVQEDVSIEVTVYRGPVRTRREHIGSGRITVGKFGLVIGPIIGGTDLIPWPAGETAVGIYGHRGILGRATGISIVLEGATTLDGNAFDRTSETAVAERVATILAWFAEPNGLDREIAASALGRLGAIALPHLLDALSSDDPRIRALAVDALGRLQGPSVIELLIASLKDTTIYVRRQAALSLRAFHDRRSVGPLLEALHDEDATVRGWAADALGNTRDKRVIDPLIQIVMDVNKGLAMRENAARSLGNLKAMRVIPQLVIACRNGDDHFRHSVSQAFVALGAPTLPVLLTLLTDEDWEMRRWAAWTLGGTRKAEAVTPLADALHDHDVRVRQAAASALGQLFNRAAAKPLLAALRDEDSGVRYSAATSLDMIGDPSMLPTLEAIRDTDTGVTSWGARVSDTAARTIKFITLRQDEQA